MKRNVLFLSVRLVFEKKSLDISHLVLFPLFIKAKKKTSRERDLILNVPCEYIARFFICKNLLKMYIQI